MNKTNTTTIISNDNTQATNGFKKTAIGLIPVDWEITDLGDLGDFKSGSGFPINEQGGNDGVPFYKVSDMNLPENEVFMTVSNNYISEEQVIKLKMKPIENEAIIFAKVGAAIFLERKRFAQNFLIDNNMMAFVPKIPSIYLKYSLDYIRLSKYAQTGALPAYNASDLKTIQLPIPPQTEQQKIAEILSTWDNAIAKCKATINTLKARNKGLANQLLTGRKRLNGFTEKWIELKADKIFRNNTDKTHNGQLEILSATQERGVIPRRMNNIDIKYDVSSLGTYKKVEIGDYVISLRSFQGGIEYSEYEGIVSPAYTILKEIIPISKTFFKVYFKTETFISRLNTIIYGIRDGKQISFKDFATLKLPCPSIEEQNAIAQVLETANQELKSYVTKLEALQLQKKGLMQQLLTGKIRVNVK
jgi:type I restriction enzyme S subunit